MVRASKLTIAAALVLGASGPFTAATAFADPEVQGRFENQQDRIEQGYDTGSLTRGEACRLDPGSGCRRRRGGDGLRRGLGYCHRHVDLTGAPSDAGGAGCTSWEKDRVRLGTLHSRSRPSKSRRERP